MYEHSLDQICFKFRELASSVVGNRAKNLLLLWISLKTREKKKN